MKDGILKIGNFYNRCKKLLLELLEELSRNLDGRVICCDDFNAHSILWDSCNDGNEEITEELMEIKTLVCVND